MEDDELGQEELNCLKNQGSKIWQNLKDHMKEAGDVCHSDVHKDEIGIMEEDMAYVFRKLDDTKFHSHEGEVSYVQFCAERNADGLSSTNSEICQKCPMIEWPNLEKTKCIPKLYEFLSYKDKIANFFCFTVILCCAMTWYTLRKFILYWDTPLVKANNRTLSFILLVSILLSFVCIFLFLGRPLDITCILRQTLFGIFFSIAISSILAKSIIVCIAFKATKPSSPWRKCTGVILPNLTVLVCSSFQLLICVSWLVMCPPYHEFNMSTYPDTIIIQCNEGSDIWFYSMLGYLGFLAAVSFVLAFMVRTLPDSFNEAKCITFSMLVFCSVWIAMIPAYLSTKGKYMVALEIFAILTSCAGILSCIFFPKLHILLVNPKINTRKHVLRDLRQAQYVTSYGYTH
ncbi:vomeronasal type-2 receptor 26-like [Phyllobates terribilis]|uniref:vomeronasal type-2 receptor 26-like n=1 Tax=Phyllobates terribilis TaxID=111132 RepID=UPI003CCB4EAA